MENAMYNNNVGGMGWMDLTVANAVEVKEFYQAVLGWECEAMAMENEGEHYNDYVMSSVVESKEKQSNANNVSSDTRQEDKLVDESFVTGICHAKGSNAEMPAAWLPYFLVADLDVGITRVKEKGGKLLSQIRLMGDDRCVVIEDPAGANFVLYQKG
jgi:predicted enzyme related to lactoylglutathione lyase